MRIFRGAVSREPLAFAADAARMGFEWCFGTSVPLLRKIPTSRAQRLAHHEMILHPDALSKQDAAIKDVGLTLCPREASAAPAAYLKRGLWKLHGYDGGSARASFRYSPRLGLHGQLHSRTTP
jgi:hypothetical protein